tara:strand:+ start:15316 stop:16458 length:1143 start_codon:yes stop_codon:yes gene_type:complete
MVLASDAEKSLKSAKGGLARKPGGPLRRGWTTGACAAAAAAAALRATLTDAAPDRVTIRLPKGETPTFDVATAEKTADGWRIGIIKDAGDDPDVTHGAEVIVTLTPRAPGDGIIFKAGPGVGMVTLPGLPVAVGEPAINPGPRGIITDALTAVAEELDGAPDAYVTISIPGGEEIALKTMNPRLGIKGGLSVLGTTGVVIPYSCASWINSIHRGVDVAKNQNIAHIIAATGSTSEAAAMKAFPDLPEQAFIDMGDFAGGLLKYLRRAPVEKLTLVGGVAKLSKLAQGHLDLHSKRSSVDMIALAALARGVGANQEIGQQIAAANTAMQAWQICADAGVSLADAIARGARETAMAAVPGDVEIAVRVYDRTGIEVGRTDNA